MWETSPYLCGNNYIMKTTVQKAIERLHEVKEDLGTIKTILTSGGDRVYLKFSNGETLELSDREINNLADTHSDLDRIKGDLSKFIGKELVFIVELEGVTYYDRFIGEEVVVEGDDVLLYDGQHDRYVTLEYAKKHILG